MVNHPLELLHLMRMKTMVKIFDIYVFAFLVVVFLFGLSDNTIAALDVPTPHPTSAPTLDHVDISFDIDIYLHNVTVTVLDNACKSAVRGAVANTLQVDRDQVTFMTQQYIGVEGLSDSNLRRLSGSVSSYQLLATVNVLASTLDYSGSVSNNGTCLYNKLSTTLTYAVESSNFSMNIRSVSLELNAAGFLYVFVPNVTISDYSIQSDAVSTADDSFVRVPIGAIVGIVLAVIVLGSCCYCCSLGSDNKIVVGTPGGSYGLMNKQQQQKPPPPPPTSSFTTASPQKVVVEV